uniref:MINDY deubiquitinase domain-containing protein n=1 Tax=Leersia perrieri TaxID=77586 RepID=A0A0D9WLW0_9ORYZ
MHIGPAFGIFTCELAQLAREDALKATKSPGLQASSHQISARKETLGERVQATGGDESARPGGNGGSTSTTLCPPKATASISPAGSIRISRCRLLAASRPSRCHTIPYCGFPSLSRMGKGEDGYMVVPFLFQGENRSALALYWDDSCPSDRSDFVSILNYLALTDPIGPANLPFRDYKQSKGKSPSQGSLSYTTVAEKDLRNHVARRFLTCMEHCKNNPELDYMDFKADRTNVIPIIQSMPTNIGLDVGLDSPINFAPTPNRVLFLYLGINIVHGWLVDPKREEKAYDVVGAQFVSELVAKLNPDRREPVHAFFACTIKTQLTAHGLTCLRMECRGVLFEQIRDINEYLNYPEAAWKSLEMAGRDAFYVTHNFNPIENQPNYAKAKKWLDEDINNVLKGLGEETKDETNKQSIDDVKNGGNNQETGREKNGSNLGEHPHGCST